MRPEGDRYDDGTLGELLDGIQDLARRLLDLDLSRHLVARRVQVLGLVGERPPRGRAWETACVTALGS